MKYGNAGVQGKGFRSLGQEAILRGRASRLRRGAAYRDADGGWHGDVVCPLIRDNALVLAMQPRPATRCGMILNAQMGKAGPPMDGKDIHVADIELGNPSPRPRRWINPVNICRAWRWHLRARGSGRVAISLIGEGGRRLANGTKRSTPARYGSCRRSSASQNNQTALSTPVYDQSAGARVCRQGGRLRRSRHHRRRHRSRGDRGAFTWAAIARAQGEGPTLIEPSSMRMCGHAHHDDMLYLGKGAAHPCMAHPPPGAGRYANRETVPSSGRKRIPIAIRRQAGRLRADAPGRPRYDLSGRRRPSWKSRRGRLSTRRGRTGEQAGRRGLRQPQACRGCISSR